jgi:hypothetical protein
MLWHGWVLASITQTGLQGQEAALSLGRGYEQLFSGFCLAILGLVAIFANSLPGPLAFQKTRPSRPWTARILAVALGLAALGLAAATNIRLIQADILFKQAEPYIQAGAGDLALETALAYYRRAHQLAPGVDYYLLHLGSLNLTQARQETSIPRREGQLAAAQEYLERAQRLNPLNPDHTANLARLYAAWADLEQDEATSQTYARAASEYFYQALNLSPNNARLWDEWAALSLSRSAEPEAALERLTHALQLDPFYDWTHALLGEYWGQAAARLSDPQAERQALEQAAGYYQEALRLVNRDDVQARYTYLVSQAAIYVRLERPQDALAGYRQAADLLPESPRRWQLEEIIAQLYIQIGDRQQALVHAAAALALAPQEQQPRLAAWIEEIRNNPY